MKIAISMKLKYLLVNRNFHACSNQACAHPEFNAKGTQLNQYARVVLEVGPTGKGFSNPAASPSLPDGCMHLILWASICFTSQLSRRYIARAIATFTQVVAISGV
jgi:hypothetical protein